MGGLEGGLFPITAPPSLEAAVLCFCFAPSLYNYPCPPHPHNRRQKPGNCNCYLPLPSCHHHRCPLFSLKLYERVKGALQCACYVLFLTFYLSVKQCCTSLDMQYFLLSGDLRFCISATQDSAIEMAKK